MTETAGRRWTLHCRRNSKGEHTTLFDVCDKGGLPSCSHHAHTEVVPAADLDALRERLEEAECLIQRVRGGSLSDVNDWNLDADRFLDAIQKGSK